MSRVEGHRADGPVTRASSTPSMRANKRVVAGRLRRTGCRGVARRLRARLRNRSKTAGPRSSGGGGDADVPIFDRTHLRDKKWSAHRLASECRADARRVAGDFEPADLAYINAGQRRCRWPSHRLADGGHAAQALGAQMRVAGPLRVSRSGGLLQRLRARHAGRAPMADPLVPRASAAGITAKKRRPRTPRTEFVRRMLI